MPHWRSVCLVIRLKRQRVLSIYQAAARHRESPRTARWWRRRTRGRRVAEVPMDAEVVTGRVRVGRRGGVYPMMRVRRRGIHGGGVLTWGWREDGGSLVGCAVDRGVEAEAHRTDGRWRARLPRRGLPARVRRPQRRRLLQGKPPDVEPINFFPLLASFQPKRIVGWCQF